VAAQNEALALERVQYELSFSNITVAVHLPAQMRYEEPLLYPVSAPAASATDDISAGNGAEQAAQVPYVLVEVDSRKTIAEFKLSVLEQCLAQLSSLGITVTTPSATLALEKVSIQLVWPATTPSWARCAGRWARASGEPARRRICCCGTARPCTARQCWLG
jgi:hypothetical protein